MSKKILILCRHDDRPSYDQKCTIESALANSDVQNDYVVDEYETLTFQYDGSTLRVILSDGVTDVSSFQVVFMMAWFQRKSLEDVALSTALYAQAHGLIVLNSEVLYTRSRTKLSQYIVATLNGIKTTPFVFSLDVATLRNAIIHQWNGGYPMILKGIQASRGNDNYLVHNENEAKDILLSHTTETGPWLIAQSFVPNNGDYRIIVMGDSVKSVIHRRAVEGSHLNNTSKGGTAAYGNAGTLPPSVIEQSVRLSKLLHREITGVDMIQHRDTGEFFLLEINNMPQLATGSYVTEKIIELDAYLGGLGD